MGLTLSPTYTGEGFHGHTPYRPQDRAPEARSS